MSRCCQVTDPDEDGGTRTSVVRCNLLVACDAPDVDPGLFRCINGSGLVYDGRLVVDARFRTNDDRIYAAGSIAKYSRELGRTGLQLGNFDSREVGQRLAASVAGRLRGETDVGTSLPRMEEPKSAECTLPGGWYFTYAGVPEAYEKPSLQESEGGRTLSTQTQGGYFQLSIGADRLVRSCLRVGRQPSARDMLRRIAGLPVSYLNNVVEKYDSGQVADLLAFLTEGWAQALYHDHFPVLRRELQGQVRQLQGGQGGVNEVAVAAVAREAVHKFVQAHAAELTAYRDVSLAS
ncbi:unnamed protein product [Ostreobium quekettii]|uniref:CFAP61 dimerisation domain-containing protein n=1 Tax=Ostreobium quekettii TaxID=121088 RepID=A0A8S1IPG8_9CHLO|nr:unnamed protein product [Ostreobium quekettii]|eukprot:evm.model.scf_57.8 EVM.evm.TU.scf_57.8   scf_57:75201-77386(+)